MKKLGLVLAAAAVLSLGSLAPTQPARADGGATVVAVVGGVILFNVVTCAVTGSNAPWCLRPAPAPKAKAKAKAKKKM